MLMALGGGKNRTKASGEADSAPMKDVRCRPVEAVAAGLSQQLP